MENQSEKDKHAKPIRETHSKYLQYIKKVRFDKATNKASVDIAFPLDFKKILMLTIAE